MDKSSLRFIYSFGWIIKIYDQSYAVIPEVDQELYRAEDMQRTIALSLIYWEGKSSVCTTFEKSISGNAYVELNGFCPKTYI